MADFDQAIASGTSTQEDVYRLFYSQAHVERNDKSYGAAIGFFEDASRFAPADRKQDVEFWWGYTYYQLGEQLATPEDAGLNRLQRAENAFGSAKTHFQRAGSVRNEIPQLLEASDRWLLNVQARIKQLQRN